MRSFTKIFISLIVLVLFTFSAVASEIPFAKRMNFIAVETQRSMLDSQYDAIDIIGVAKFGNACKVEDIKFKTMSQDGVEYFYNIFGADGETTHCPKIYLPVKKSFFIDRIKVLHGTRVTIYVNGNLIGNLIE